MYLSSIPFLGIYHFLIVLLAKYPNARQRTQKKKKKRDQNSNDRSGFCSCLHLLYSIHSLVSMALPQHRNQWDREVYLHETNADHLQPEIRRKAGLFCFSLSAPALLNILRQPIQAGMYTEVIDRSLIDAIGEHMSVASSSALSLSPATRV